MPFTELVSESVAEDSWKWSFLMKMFWETKTIVEPRAWKRPTTFAESSKEQASITPSVRGKREKYVEGE